MKYVTINNRKVAFSDEKNLLTIIRKAGIDIPTFCYHSELSTYGACRMCVVEDDKGKIFASCSEVPKDGMVIYTHTPKLQHHRRMILELLLSSHCHDCKTCEASRSCILQKMAYQLGLGEVRFENNRRVLAKDESSNCIVIDPNKCILCGDCVRTCEEIQGIGVLNFAHRGSSMRVTTAFDRPIVESGCVGCGQCRVVCPTGAIMIKSNEQQVWDLLADKSKRVVVQIAPAVRIAIGDAFGIPKGENSLGKLVAALRMMGFAEIYDTNFGADITVIEEAKEFLQRLEKKEKLPLFTSCCPAWVKFCENKFPQFRANISTCRSPQQMFGAIIKEEAKSKDDKRETVVVSIMPCTAKKDEIKRKEHYTDGVQNVDYVLTTSEVTHMIQEIGIDLATIKEEALDMPFGMASGSAAIFGVSGGVSEAVIRYLVNSNAQADLETIRFMGVRGGEGIKEAIVPYQNQEVRIAVVSGLANAKKLLKQIENGEVHYDLVEVMACRRGCIAGGGQPLPIGDRTKKARLASLYKIDDVAQIKLAQENIFVEMAYKNIIKDKAHKLLHND